MPKRRPRPTTGRSPTRRRCPGGTRPTVVLSAAGAVAVACAGFAIWDHNRKSCVDPQTQTVVDDNECRRPGGVGRWYYGGNSRVANIGDKASGGSFERSGFGRGVAAGLAASAGSAADAARPCPPRPDWRATVEAQGLVYAVTTNGEGELYSYWDESAYYEFDLAEVERLEDVVAELHAMAVHTVGWVVEQGRYGDYGITDPAWSH